MDLKTMSAPTRAPTPTGATTAAATSEAVPASAGAALPVRIVLVEAQHPGNIGSAARAMKNMGLRDLALVAPHKFPHEQATALAAGAVDVLEHARVFDTLAEAVADCVHVAGTTARSRYLSHPVYTARQWAERRVATIADGPVALLFGRERTGLTNAELDEAQELVTIPVDAAYPSLNLAQAVQVLCYELRQAQPTLDGVRPPRDVVSQRDMDHFYAHLERTLVATRFLDPDNPRLIMRRLRLLFGRLEPDGNEMNILRGILTSVETGLRGHFRGRGD